MNFGELRDVKQTAPDSEWDLTRECHAQKDTVDDQEVDEPGLMSESQETSLLPRFDPANHVNLHYAKAYYAEPREGGRKTRVSEKSYIMQWRGQHFKCQVGLSLEPSMPKSNWTIGLAQTCDKIDLKNHFGPGGYYAWEFHPLKSGLFNSVNDSNGSQWPFYSHRSAMLDMQKGRPIGRKFYEFRFSDYFFPTMHWSVESGNRHYGLTTVKRKQNFRVWLVAIKRGRRHRQNGRYSLYSQFRPDEDEIFFYKQMGWKYNIRLEFDVHRDLGERCVAIHDDQKEQPRISEYIDDYIPTAAMVPPNCNSCQSLIFYPSDKANPLVLRKQPEDMIVPWYKWRKHMTRGYTNVVGFEEPMPLPRRFRSYRRRKWLDVCKIVTPFYPVPQSVKDEQAWEQGTNAQAAGQV